jgi:hypothetical protein
MRPISGRRGKDAHAMAAKRANSYATLLLNTLTMTMGSGADLHLLIELVVYDTAAP